MAAPALARSGFSLARQSGLARALGLNPDETPDQREIVLSCPRDMVFETAMAHNVELTPPPR